MVTIEASILPADFAHLGEQAREAESAGVDAIQVDVMDRHFVNDSQLDEIRRLQRMLAERSLDTLIAADGGIDATTAPLVVSAGATVLVAGSSIYNDEGAVAQNVAALRANVA